MAEQTHQRTRETSEVYLDRYLAKPTKQSKKYDKEILIIVENNLVLFQATIASNISGPSLAKFSYSVRA